jgi:hypothetical protein
MFQFMQEPSSGSYFVLNKNYIYDSILLIINDVVNVMVAYQPVCVWYIVEVEVGTVYRTLAQQAGMP